jgi:ribose 5-phosphate isomerase B
MKIAVASDHAGFRRKQAVRAWLEARGHEVIDFGAPGEQPVDYPDFIRPAAVALAKGTVARAVMFGGSGNGEAIVANRVPGVRCAYCFNEESARLGRAHNDANAIAIGQRMVSDDEALRIVEVWLDTPFEGGRHARRVAKIDA